MLHAGTQKMLSQWRQLSQRQGYERWQWLELSKYGSHAARPSLTRCMARISQQVWPHTEHRLLSQRERTFEGFPFPPAMGGRTKNYAELCRTMEFHSEAESCWLKPSTTCYRLLRYRVWLSVPFATKARVAHVRQKHKHRLQASVCSQIGQCVQHHRPRVPTFHIKDRKPKWMKSSVCIDLKVSFELPTQDFRLFSAFLVRT